MGSLINEFPWLVRPEMAPAEDANTESKKAPPVINATSLRVVPLPIVL